MGRKPRIIYSGALYHIIQRGNNKNYIYEDSTDKSKFLKLLLEAREKCEFHILYFTLMDNHFHVILESSEIPISKGIQHLNTAYSKYYNQKYNRSGGIYGGRYTSMHITDAAYYRQIIRYIAYNPVRANLVKKPDEYRWGAHQAVKNGDDRIIEIERMISHLPGPETKALEEYFLLIEQKYEIKPEYWLIQVKDAQKLSDYLDQILRDLRLSEDIVIRIKRGDKSIYLTEHKNKFIKEAYSYGFKIKDIATHISYSYEGVRKVVRDSL